MPAISRKSPEEWESVKNLIHEYFILQNEPLNKTMAYMEKQHGFEATQKEYRRRLEQWGMRKNIPKDAWQDIGEENVNGKRIIRGIPVSYKRLKRSVSRYGIGSTCILPSVNAGKESHYIPWFYFEDTTLNYLRSSIEAIIPRLPWVNPPGTPIHAFSLAELSIKSARALLGTFFDLEDSGRDHDATSRVVEYFKNHMPRRSGTGSRTISVEPFLLLTQSCIYLSSNALLLDSLMDRFLRWTYEVGAALRLNEFIDKLINKLQENSNATTEIFLFRLLQSAVSLQLEGLAHILLRKGVNPNQNHSKCTTDRLGDFSLHQDFTPLQVAVLKGNLRLCKLLLGYKASANATSQSAKMTPLFMAVSVGHGNLDIANILVKSGSDVNCWSDVVLRRRNHRPGPFEPVSPESELYCSGRHHNRSVLMEAIDHQSLDITQLLLEHGAKIHEVSIVLGNALQIAVGNGDADMVKLLFQKGAHLDMVEAVEDSVVEYVVQHIPNCVKPIYEETVEDWIRLKVTLMPLQIAAYRDDLVMVKLLLGIGAQANHPRLDWNRVCDRILGLSGQDISKIIDELKDLFGIRFYGSGSALHAAVENNNVEMTRLLLEAGAIVDDTDPFGATALQVSCGLRQFQIKRTNYPEEDNPDQDFSQESARLSTSVSNLALARLLLDWKADINFLAGRVQGRTALQAAVQSENEDLIEFLLLLGANVNAPAGTDDGLTAIEAAALSGKPKLVAQLVKAGARSNPTIDSMMLHAAAGKGFELCVIDLLKGNVDVNTTLLNQSNPKLKGSVLQVAIKGHHPVIVRKLLDHSVDLDAVFEEETALCTAVQAEAPDILSALLNAGANPNIQGVQVTPLALAASIASKTMVEMLLKADADVNQLSYGLGSCWAAKALSWTLSTWCDVFVPGLPEDADKIVTLLLKHGAEPNETTSKHTYPIEYVAELGSIDLLTILLDMNADVDAPCTDIPLEWAFTIWVSHSTTLTTVKSEQITRKIVSSSKEPQDKSALLWLAIRDKYFDWAEEMLDERTKTDWVWGFGSALKAVCDSGQITLVEKLLEKYPASLDSVLNPELLDDYATSLWITTTRGHFNIVKLLLDHGAKDGIARVRVPNGLVFETALQKAASLGRLDITFLLLQRDDEPRTLPSRCINAAKRAADSGHRILAQKLREYASKLNRE